MTDSEQWAMTKVLQVADLYGGDLSVRKTHPQWEAELWWEDDVDEDSDDPVDGGDTGVGATPMAAIVDLARRLT